MPEDEGQPEPRLPGDVPAAGQRPMKTCPDCAELVLEAARKCRYCGYEFRPAPAAPAPMPPPTAPGLFGLLFRRSARPLTMEQTLAQLGIELDPGEQLTGLWLAQASGVDGYVVLTDQRLFFVTGLRRDPANPPPRQHSLDELAGAEVRSRHLKSGLVLRWHDSPDTSIGGMPLKTLHQLHQALLAALERGRTAPSD